MVYINNGEHDNPHELPKENLEGPLDTNYTDYTHADFTSKLPEEIEKLENIYQHFQGHEKIYETDLQVTTEQTDDALYPHQKEYDCQLEAFWVHLCPCNFPNKWC